MYDHDLIDWTGWLFGLVSIIWIVYCEHRERRRRRQLRDIASLLEPSAPLHAPAAAGSAAPPVTTAPGLPARDYELDDRLRSALIQVGVNGLPFSIAVARARRFGADREQVEAAARTLRDSKLLRFDEPLGDNTKVRLN